MGDYRWRGYAHKELHEMINNGPGVGASTPLELRWTSLSESLGRIDADLQTALGKMGADWEGSTAAAAQDAMSPLTQWAADAQTGSNVMSTSAQWQGDYIADARKEMPEPVKVTTEAPGFWDHVGGAMTGPFGAMDVINQQKDHEAQEAAQDNAEQKAIQVMNNYESSSTSNRETLGHFSPPPQVVIDTPPPSGTGTGTGVGYTPSGTGSTGNQGTTNTSWTPPPVAPPVAPPPGNFGNGNTNTSWTPPTTTPPPPPANPPVFTPPGQGGGNTHLPPGSPVFSRPGGGSGGPGGPGAGRGGAGGKAFSPMSGGLGSGAKGGMPGMTPGGMAGMADDGHNQRPGAAAAGAAGRGGAAGGMAAGGAGGAKGANGEEDKEHKAADYLVEADDVFGDERLVAPPVIGGAPEA